MTTLWGLLGRVRNSSRTDLVVAHWPAAIQGIGLWQLIRGRRFGPQLIAVGWLGWLANYGFGRVQDKALREEHLRRMRRVRRDVLDAFYIQWAGSMEEKITAYPLYDRHKQEMRYDLVTRLAVDNTPAGGTLVDVGSASGIVLDRVNLVRGSRGIGFDLASYGLAQRVKQPDPPVLAEAKVEEIPLPDGIADVVVFSEVIEHLVDAYAGLAEISRITRTDGVVILTTNNASEMPESSPLVNPLAWVERLVGRWRPSILAFRNMTWHEPIPESSDPLPREAPTFPPHLHMAFSELRDLAFDAGLDLVSSGSFEFPAPQSRFAAWLRKLYDRQPHLGRLASDGLEKIVAATPYLSLMGTHNLVVLNKVRPPLASPSRPWWPVAIIEDPQSIAGTVRLPASNGDEELVSVEMRASGNLSGPEIVKDTRGYTAMVKQVDEMLDVLACPRCKGGLNRVGTTLVCHRCQLSYPILDGIPVLMVSRAERIEMESPSI